MVTQTRVVSIIPPTFRHQPGVYWLRRPLIDLLAVIAWHDEESRAHLLTDGWHASHICGNTLCIEPTHIAQVESRFYRQTPKRAHYLDNSTRYGTAAPPQAQYLLPAIEPSTLALSTVALSPSPNSSPGATVTLSDDYPPSDDSRTLTELYLLSPAVAQRTWERLRGGRCVKLKMGTSRSAPSSKFAHEFAHESVLVKSERTSRRLG
ncbi:hypothetical protein NM208_g15717 [Fusarium decemcellulare]|uniref:Uncharacterized protein n=1 Tax=Fusarium decemcellulare TaxID=57161 RepID=A0ACC1RCC4_9HYPO|nr:hypothetical protein NM208_g15717 [Fusarium decemcellulare]